MICDPWVVLLVLHKIPPHTEKKEKQNFGEISSRVRHGSRSVVWFIETTAPARTLLRLLFQKPCFIYLLSMKNLSSCAFTYTCCLEQNGWLASVQKDWEWPWVWGQPTAVRWPSGKRKKEKSQGSRLELLLLKFHYMQDFSNILPILMALCNKNHFSCVQAT